MARDEAQRFNQNTSHGNLLLGLVREGAGVAARVLEKMNVELAKVRPRWSSYRRGDDPWSVRSG